MVGINRYDPGTIKNMMMQTCVNSEMDINGEDGNIPHILRWLKNCVFLNGLELKMTKITMVKPWLKYKNICVFEL